MPTNKESLKQDPQDMEAGRQEEESFGSTKAQSGNG